MLKLKNKFLIFFTLFTLVVFQTKSQNSIAGNFSSIKGQTIRLIGYRGVDVITIDTAVVNAQGEFKLYYSDANLGMGYLLTSENKPHMMVLEKGNVQLTGQTPADASTIIINSGEQNKIFVQYAQVHDKRKQALSAWGYLKNLYELDTLFKNEYATKLSINKEIDHLNKADNDFLQILPPNSFMYWYLPIRKLISDVGAVANTRPEIQVKTKTFRSINYAHPLLYNSGLFSDILESQFWLIENSGLERTMLAKEMNTSVDSILASVNKNEKLYNEFTNYLFQYFEKHSLFASSEYIALKVLNQQEMKLSMALVNRLETYRKIKIGGIAPKIEFKGDVYVNRALVNNINGLSDIKSKYKIVIFGGSWCSSCRSEVIQVIPHYENWKKQGIEVVIVSLDTDKKAFEEFATEFPFIFACDYKKWETQAAKDYYVSSSPTIFLLDSNNKIILRPPTVPVLDSWLQNNKEKMK
jgi:thiol-disulfide isomerase/thioredoxin